MAEHVQQRIVCWGMGASRSRRWAAQANLTKRRRAAFQFTRRKQCMLSWVPRTRSYQHHKVGSVLGPQVLRRLQRTQAV